jgi:hypothetical protein
MGLQRPPDGKYLVDSVHKWELDPDNQAQATKMIHETNLALSSARRGVNHNPCEVRTPAPHRRGVTETNRLQFVLFGVQNRTLGPYIGAGALERCPQGAATRGHSWTRSPQTIRIFQSEGGLSVAHFRAKGSAQDSG